MSLSRSRLLANIGRMLLTWAMVSQPELARAVHIEVIARDGDTAPGGEGLVFDQFGGSHGTRFALHDDGTVAFLSTACSSPGVLCSIYRKLPKASLELVAGVSAHLTYVSPRCISSSLRLGSFVGPQSGNGPYLGLHAGGAFSVSGGFFRRNGATESIVWGVGLVPGICDGGLVVEFVGGHGMSSDTGITAFGRWVGPQDARQDVLRRLPDGSVQAVASVANPAPGTDLLYSGVASLVFANNRGDILFHEILTATAGGTQGPTAVFVSPADSGATELVVESGTTAAPAGEQGVLTLLSSVPSAAIAEDGSVVFASRRGPTQIGFYRKRLGQPIQRIAAVTGAHAVPSHLAKHFADTSGGLLLRRDAGSQGTIEYIDGDGQARSVLASGDPAPGLPGETLTAFRADTALNDLGQGLVVGRASSGRWSLFLLSHLRCGNAIVDREEGCDDGNTVDGDGCDSNCKPTGCGSGIVTAGEECDDENGAPCDGCDRSCRIRVCGPCEAGWSIRWFRCDDGHDNDFALQRDGTPVCGSGNCAGAPGTCWGPPIVERSFESSGNVSWTIGTSGELNVGQDRDVQVYGETFLNVSVPTTLQVPLAADAGRVWLNEFDVTAGGPAGAVTLNLASGWNHLEWTSYNQHEGTALAMDFPFARHVDAMGCRVPVCGDDVVDPGEECDDGNIDDGDGCSAGCRREATPTPAATPTATHTATPTATPTASSLSIRKCRAAIANASAAFVQAAITAQQQCRAKIVAGKFAGPCPDGDQKTSEKMAKALGQLHDGIAKACGGKNKSCGPTDGGANADEHRDALGFPAVCPGFGGSCINAIADRDCGDISTCLGCIGGAAVGRAIALSYDVSPADPKTRKSLNACQQAIGKSAVRFFVAKSKALQRCWERIDSGKTSGPCPDAKTAQPVIANAAARMDEAIAKACCGKNKTCNALDTGADADFAVAEIGHWTDCEAVTGPGSLSCAGPLTDAQSLIDCIDCVTNFTGDCAAVAAVPQLAEYPAECAP